MCSLVPLFLVCVRGQDNVCIDLYIGICDGVERNDEARRGAVGRIETRCPFKTHVEHFQCDIEWKIDLYIGICGEVKICGCYLFRRWIPWKHHLTRHQQQILQKRDRNPEDRILSELCLRRG